MRDALLSVDIICVWGVGYYVVIYAFICVSHSIEMRKSLWEMEKVDRCHREGKSSSTSPQEFGWRISTSLTMVGYSERRLNSLGTISTSTVSE
jgi:hypothetical protein